MSSYDAIVIGSGFGGAITAAKLAQTGATVLMLEQGHRWRTPLSPREVILRSGDRIVNKWNVNDEETGFPKSPGDTDAWGNPNYVLQQSTDLKYIFYRFPGTGHYSGGLFEDYDSRFNRSGSANPFLTTVGRGYGGGSLIYSMIHLRAPTETFQFDQNGGVEWPDGYTRAGLDPFYNRVESTVPVWQLSYDAGDARQISKRSAVLADAFARAGMSCEPLRLGLWGDRFAQSRESSFINPFRVPVRRCTGCGFCTFGCIFESKASLPTNYLAVAEQTGNLSVRTDAQAWSIEPVGGAYRLHWKDRRTGQVRSDQSTIVVSCGGAIGSPELLLRSRMAGFLPDLSPHAGYHLSGNGDSVFGILFNGLPEDFKAEIYKGSIMNLVSYHSWLSPPEGIRFVLHDVSTLPVGISKFPLRRQNGDLEPRAEDPCNTDPNRGAALYWGRYWKAFIKENYSRNVLALASVGLDSPDGQVQVDSRGQAQVRWNTRLEPGNRTFELIDSVRKVVDDVSAASPYGAERLHSQGWDDLRRYTTVHVVGGCRMSDHGPTGERGGVVDGNGQVYNYPGLYVVDGSAMPGAVGVSPSHTISAVAEKMTDVLVGA
ncbi:MAG: GMC oxidoreductase [Acidobacteriota bacterium]